MIFVTVGTQLPFDRLIKAVDSWAADNPGVEVLAQIGNGGYQPMHMVWSGFLDPEMFRERVRSARLVVSHAGTGNLLLALEACKPIVMMPRRAALNEHRNDHQLATAKWLKGLPGVTIADDVDDLRQALTSAEWAGAPALRPEASPELLAAIREFLNQP